jgi:hypothetical protein
VRDDVYLEGLRAERDNHERAGGRADLIKQIDAEIVRVCGEPARAERAIDKKPRETR